MKISPGFFISKRKTFVGADKNFKALHLNFGGAYRYFKAMYISAGGRHGNFHAMQKNEYLQYFNYCDTKLRLNAAVGNLRTPKTMFCAPHGNLQVSKKCYVHQMETFEL